MRRRVAEWVAGAGWLYIIALALYFGFSDKTFGHGVVGWWTGFLLAMSPGLVLLGLAKLIDRPLRPDEHE